MPDQTGGGSQDLIGGGSDGQACVDSDGDSYGTGCNKGPDCDDGDSNAHPGAIEICDDKKDNNCNGSTDEMPCQCLAGSTRACYGGKVGTDGIGPCRMGLQKCDTKGAWGSCDGEVVPTTEVCDGADNNCDGYTDEGLLNTCGTCGAPPAETCGDGFDNNCNGTIDENCGTCDPGCLCMGGLCSCQPPTNQPCYGGSPQTSGKGICRQGVHDCVKQVDGTYKWSTCVGEVLPTAPMCNGQDNDCDGALDDGLACPCVDGAVRSCGSSFGECRKGTQTCASSQWGACTGGVMPVPEACDGKDNDCNGVTDEGVANACGTCGPTPMEQCGDGIDNNCNGLVDEESAGCSCGGKTQQACYRGAANTRMVGACHDGMQFCVTMEIGDYWGACGGDQLPTPEVCNDAIDNDCDGVTDNGCTCATGDTRPCGVNAGECTVGTQTCTNGAWSKCSGKPAAPEACDGKDNNCNGLTDEGVLNACGKCAPMPCFTVDYSMPGNCQEPNRNCAGVVPDPNNPSAITLGETTNQLQPFIYISVTNKNEVAQLNTETGVKMWQKPTYGVLPSRTAVALDGTVWVGNRCLVGGRENDYTCSSVVHLDLNGNLICRADTSGWIRGVAIDADGHVWAGAYNGAAVHKIDGTLVDNTQNPPRCRILSPIPNGVAVGVNVYGVAIDGLGFLYTASPAATTAQVDTKAIKLVKNIPNNTGYGVAVDKANRVWFGGWHAQAAQPSGNMHRLDPASGAILTVPNTLGVTAVTVHPDGSVWGSIYCQGLCANRGVYKVTLDAQGNNILSTQYFADPEGQSTHGVAVDRANKIWSPQVWLRGTVNRWTTAGVRENLFTVDAGQELYTYSDMTGIQLRTITARDGHWYQVFDSAYLKPIWDHAEWTATIPAMTSVTVSVRAGDSIADFSNGNATAWCGPFAASPASFGACAFLNNHRYAQVDVRLNTTQDGIKPSVSDVKLFWSY